MGTQKYRLIETVPLSTQKEMFQLIDMKIIKGLHPFICVHRNIHFVSISEYERYGTCRTRKDFNLYRKGSIFHFDAKRLAKLNEHLSCFKLLHAKIPSGNNVYGFGLNSILSLINSKRQLR